MPGNASGADPPKLPIARTGRYRMQTDFSEDDLTPGEEVRFEPAGVAVGWLRGAKHLMSSPY